MKTLFKPVVPAGQSGMGVAGCAQGMLIRSAGHPHTGLAETVAACAHLWAWRHPRPHGAQGRCIGRTDLAVDRRRAKRLARRIQKAARRHGLPRVVCTSPLRRCADVARWLRRWGWTHHTDPALLEMDFGGWDGVAWDTIDVQHLSAWTDDFAVYAPGGGESLRQMLARVAAWTPPQPAVLVAHGGWMLARRWLAESPDAPPRADQWPAPPRYGEVWVLPLRAIDRAG